MGTLVAGAFSFAITLAETLWICLPPGHMPRERDIYGNYEPTHVRPPARNPFRCRAVGISLTGTSDCVRLALRVLQVLEHEAPAAAHRLVWPKRERIARPGGATSTRAFVQLLAEALDVVVIGDYGDADLDLGESARLAPAGRRRLFGPVISRQGRQLQRVQDHQSIRQFVLVIGRSRQHCGELLPR